MMNGEQSLRNHHVIKYPENTQKTDRGTSQAEERFQQTCCYAYFLKFHLSMGAPLQIHHLYPKMPLKQNTSKGCFASDEFITHSLRLM